MQYEINGGNLPVVVCYLNEGETIITQSGGMAWMGPNMKMGTKMGGLGKGIGRRMMGESAFQNHYTCMRGKGLIAFASKFPGEIRAFEIEPGREIIMQKKSFLAGSDGVNLSVYFQKRISAGLWGGEGFIMQRFSGSGIVFAEMDGSVTEYDLGQGQQIVMETGYLAAMDATCSMDIQLIPGVKNLLFGGEGFCNTIVTGPGHVWIQSIPINSLAAALIPHLPFNRQ